MTLADLPIVVQKFGGTSLRDGETRAAAIQRIRECLKSDRAPVVVVSAMGRSPEPYATDSLLSLVDGAQTEGREKDRLLACGEIIATAVLAQELASAGIPARGMSGAEAGIHTDGTHGSASVDCVDPTGVRDCLGRGFVPVVAGFQGTSEAGETTTLGRGGSDTTACALAIALEAESVEIFSDVEGVYTTDPRVLPEARVLRQIAYEELFQLARHGSKVVHTPAAELAHIAGIPMRVRSTTAGTEGTTVANSDSLKPLRVDRVATAVTHVDGVARIIVDLPQDATDGGHMRAQALVFRRMADAGVSLDMFTPFRDSLVFSVKMGDVPASVSTLDDVGLPYSVETDLAKVTLVGTGMHGVPGVMARVADALSEAGVTVMQVADSHATISVLVCQNSRSTAVSALHRRFELHSNEAAD